MAEDDDRRAAEFENPDKLQADGPGRRVRPAGSSKTLSSHVPIRFDAEMIAVVKQIADDEGHTVSSWVRRLVQREVERRQRRTTTVSSAMSPGIDFANLHPDSYSKGVGTLRDVTTTVV